MSVKEQALQAIQRFPDDIDYRTIVDKIALLAARPRAQDGISHGRIVANDQVKTRPPRPAGLCAGEFVTPADFDDPLSADILQDFEEA